MTHILKTDPAVFEAILDGSKPYTIRLNDRGYAVGDVLQLRETASTGAEIAAGAALQYTGREVTKTVSHVLDGYGLGEGWVILSFASVTPAAAAESGAAGNDNAESMMPALQSLFAEVFHSPAGDARLEVFRERLVSALTDYVGATLTAAREKGDIPALAQDEGAMLFGRGPAPKPIAREPAMAWAVLGDDGKPFHSTCFSTEAMQHRQKGRTVIPMVPQESKHEEAALYLAIDEAQRHLPVGQRIVLEVTRGRSGVDWEGSPAGLVVMNGCGTLTNAVREATRAAIAA